MAFRATRHAPGRGEWQRGRPLLSCACVSISACLSAGSARKPPETGLRQMRSATPNPPTNLLPLLWSRWLLSPKRSSLQKLGLAFAPEVRTVGAKTYRHPLWADGGFACYLIISWFPTFSALSPSTLPFNSPRTSPSQFLASQILPVSSVTNNSFGGF